MNIIVHTVIMSFQEINLYVGSNLIFFDFFEIYLFSEVGNGR